MNENFLFELFIECYTLQSLQKMYFIKAHKNGLDPNYNQFSLELKELFNEKFDYFIEELKKSDRTISKIVNDFDELNEGVALYHINKNRKSIRAMKSFGLKAIFREE